MTKPNIEEIIKEFDDNFNYLDFAKETRTAYKNIKDFIRQALTSQEEYHEKEIANRMNDYARWGEEALNRQEEYYEKMKTEQKEAIKKTINKCHGGGNGRRLLLQLLEKYE